MQASDVNWLDIYKRCDKYSRAELNQIALSNGINPKLYSQKKQLCDALKQYIETKGYAPSISVGSNVELISSSGPASMNDDLANKIEELSKLARKGNVYRANALSSAARSIRNFPKQITLDNLNDIQSELGVGPTIIERIKIILTTGTHPDLAPVDKSINVINPIVIIDKKQEIIDEIKSVYEFGEAAATRYVAMGVTSIPDLIEKVNSGLITLNDKQIIGLTYYLHFRERIPYDEVEKMGQYVLHVLKQLDPNSKGEIVGSHRRGHPTSGDVDILITGPDLTILNKLFNKLVSNGFIIHKLIEGEKTVRGTFWSTFPVDQDPITSYQSGIMRKIDIKIVPERSWGTGLLHYTGSDDFNQGVRSYLKKHNLSLSEYSISTTDGKAVYYYSNEEDVFKSISIPYIQPRDRDSFRF